MDPGRARALLAEERERLERSMAGVDPRLDAEPSDEHDPNNLGSDLYRESVDAALEEDLRAQMAAVERAEARLAAGTYGLSIESGQPIPDARLEAIPTAELTLEEEREREHR